MSFFNKHFFVGVATGMAITLVIIVAGIGVGAYFVMKMVPAEKELATLLPEPIFPPEGQLATHGRADVGATLQALSGEKILVSELEGRVVFLNMWATWCKPCIAELPGIQRLFESFKDEPVAFVLVSPEKLDHVKDYMASTELTVPVFVWETTPPTVFKSQVIPATFIMDRAGNVVFRHIGAAKWDSEPCQAFLKYLVRAGESEPWWLG